jgi:hypothetical protein
MVALYDHFVENCSQLVELLHTLQQNGPKFIWAESQQTLFNWLKAALLTPLTPVRWRFQLFSIAREVKI